MGKIVWCSILSLAATLYSQAALAQPDAGTSCLMVTCRAMFHFRTCERPLEGVRIVRGRVANVERAPCSEVLSLEVLRASRRALPARIRVDLGPCAFWAGTVGDVIAVAVIETQ